MVARTQTQVIFSIIYFIGLSMTLSFFAMLTILVTAFGFYNAFTDGLFYVMLMFMALALTGKHLSEAV